MSEGHYFVDVESAGPKNGIFAFGIAYCRGVDLETVQTGEVYIHLRTPEEIRQGTDWKQVWINHGYDMGTFDWWMDGKLDTLNTLQDPNSPNIVFSQIEFIDRINALIREAEEYAGVTIAWSDTICFDTCEISNLLAKGDYPRFQFNRQGNYRSGMEVDSYIKGLLNLGPFVHWKLFGEMEKKYLDMYKGRDVPHNHLPGNDAHHNLKRVVAAQLFQQSGGLVGARDMEKGVDTIMSAFKVIFILLILLLLFFAVIPVFTE
jgi:hypothetical protein